VRSVTFAVLSLFVFSLPSEVLVSFQSVGTASRIIGLSAAIVGVLTVFYEGRFRKPGVIMWLSFAFAMANTTSLLWTTDYDPTVVRVQTYGQLFGLVWLLWEFARRRVDQERLMLAYCLGALFAVAQILHNYSAGVGYTNFFNKATSRYVVSGFDPNDCGLTLALGIPMAWHLFVNSRGAARLMITYVPAACIAILLTASRGAFMSASAALLIVPLALPRGKGIGRVLAVAAVCLMAGAAALTVVPESSWDRIATAREEITEGTMNGRRVIWTAAWRAFQERPLLGVGAGAFRSAVARMPLADGGRFPHSTAPHNTFLAVLVEQGLVGFAIFGILLGACGALMWGTAAVDRKTAAVLMLTWLVGSMSLGWQYQKPTWLLFGLLAVLASNSDRCREAARRKRADGEVAGFVLRLSVAPIDRVHPAPIQVEIAGTAALSRQPIDGPKVEDLIVQLIGDIRTLQSQLDDAFGLPSGKAENVKHLHVERMQVEEQ
jgi:O-antigen ligase